VRSAKASLKVAGIESSIPTTRSVKAQQGGAEFDL
jgi:hypothetical protein